MALRADNFASPTAATFEVLDDDLLMVSGSGTVEWSGWTDDTIQIPRDKTVVSGTLVGIYDKADLIDEFMIETQTKSLSEEGDPTWTLSGPQINGLLAKIDVRPQDYPIKPTVVRDWIWDGTNLLSNPGMEDISSVSEIYEIELDGASSGDFTVTVGGATTPSQQWDVSETDLETAIEALSGTPAVVDVDVDSQSDGYRIEFVDPANLDVNMTWIPNLGGGGGDEELNVIQEGDSTQPPSWTRSQFLDSGADPKLHGTYASDGGFRLTKDAEPVDTGSFALRVNGLTQYAGAQQVVSVIPGQTYQASVRLFTSNTGPATERFKLIMRDARNHQPIPGAQSSDSISDNTWTTLSIDDVLIPAGVTQIIFRIASVIDQNPSPWYMDNAVFSEGFPAATPGEIIRILLEAAQNRSVGEWIDLDFTDTDDTNSTVWGAGISFRAFPPQTFAHALEGLHQLGVNWTLKRKATPVGALTHDLRAYGKDVAPDKTSIVEILAVQDGTVKDRLPAANSRIAYGEKGIWDELDDSPAITSFGKWEGGYEAEHLTSEATLATFLSDIETEEQTNRLALQATMHQGDDYAPLVLFRPGDLVTWQFPGIQPSVDRAVKTISWEQGEIARYQITGSKIYDNETGLARAVEFLLDEIKPRARLEPQGVAPLPVGGTGQGAVTVLVAAFDALPATIGSTESRFQCVGSSDHLVVQAALDSLPAAGGRVLLSEGTFFMSGDVDLPGKSVVLEGAGSIWSAAAGTGGITATNGGKHIITGFTFTNTTEASNTQKFIRCDSRVEVTNNYFHDMTVHAVLGSELSGDFGRYIITNNHFDNITLHRNTGGVNRLCIFLDSGAGSRAQDAIFANNLCKNIVHLSHDGYIVWSDVDQGTVQAFGNQVEDSSGLSGQFANATIASHNVIEGVHVPGDHAAVSAPGIDSTAIHDDVDAEISAIAEKTVPVAADLLVIEDSADTDAKKRLQIGNLPYQLVTRFSQSGITTYDGSLEYRAYFPTAQTIVAVEASLGTQPTGQQYEVDIHKNGTTIFTTQSNRPIIAVSTNRGVATLEVTAIAAGEYLTMDIDQVGSGVIGEFLTVTVITENA